MLCCSKPAGAAQPRAGGAEVHRVHARGGGSEPHAAASVVTT